MNTYSKTLYKFNGNKKSESAQHTVGGPWVARASTGLETRRSPVRQLAWTHRRTRAPVSRPCVHWLRRTGPVGGPWFDLASTGLDAQAPWAARGSTVRPLA